MANRTADEIKRWAIPALLAVIPLLVVVVKTTQYGMTCPYWDEWNMVQYIEKSVEGHVTLGEWWVQHNEHRPLFARVLIVWLAKRTFWNIGYELGASIVAAGIALWCLLVIAFHVARNLKCDIAPWLLPAFSFLIFSYAQMENWIWGWQLSVFLHAMGVAAGIALLSRDSRSWVRFVAAACAGAVATYSFANGLLFWIVALPVVLVDADGSKSIRWQRGCAWAAFGLLVYVSYFWGYKKPGVSPNLVACLHHPVAWLGYIIVYLGGPMTGLIAPPAWHGLDQRVAAPPQAFIPGIVGVVLFLALAYGIHVRRRIPVRLVAPWHTLAAFAAASAAVTGAGRVGFGLGQALASRYMTVALLWWCALAGLAAAFLQTRPSGAARPVRPLSKWAAGAFAAALVVTGQALFIHQNRHWEELAVYSRLGWDAILIGHEAPSYLQDLCWSPQELKENFLPVMKKYGLSGFTKTPRIDPARADAYVAAGRTMLERGLIVQGGTFLQTALRFDPNHAEARRLLDETAAEFRKRRSSVGAESFRTYPGGAAPRENPDE